MKWDLLTFFIVVWDVTFLISPVAAVLARRSFKDWAAPTKRTFIALNLALIAIATLILTTKWSFSGLVADAIVLAAGYFAYTALLFLISLIKPKWLTWSVVGLGLIPTAVGVFLGITMLGLLFILGDMVPREEARLSRNYSYRISWYGGAIADHDGAELTILYHPTYLPFIEEELLKKDYEDSDYDFQNLSVDLFGGQVRISCPRAKTGAMERTVLARN